MTSTMGMSRTRATGPQSAPRKLVIKPLKSKPQQPPSPMRSCRSLCYDRGCGCNETNVVKYHHFLREGLQYAALAYLALLSSHISAKMGLKHITGPRRKLLSVTLLVGRACCLPGGAARSPACLV